ncbi:nickel-binding protein [Maribacter arcticus]|uniref:nickel-binding protein n=1 Tax=Maribacter arcticus TaxID=561365 RepID=UPI0030D87301
MRKKAFCLIAAPSKESLIELHENAHGAVPTSIIEVNDTIIESFLVEKWFMSNIRH